MTASEITPTKLLLGGAGALQVLLTATAASNGSLVAVATNELALLIVSVGLVTLAVVIGGVIAFLKPGRRLLSVLTVVGLLALVGGIWLTGYIVIVGPSVAKAPDIDVTLTGEPGKYALTGEVKASGIKQDEHYWVEVDARSYKGSSSKASYVQLGPALYLAQLGADSQGTIDTKFTVPLASPSFHAVSVEAWYGNHVGPCGSLTVEGGATLGQAKVSTEATSPAPAGAPESKAVAEAQEKATEAREKTTAEFIDENSRPGCVLVRLPE